MNLTPLFVASCAALLAFLGWQFTLRDFLTSERLPRRVRTTDAKDSLRVATPRRWRSDLPKQLLNMAIALISVYIISKMLTSSTEISAALAIIAISLPQLIASRRAAQFQREQERSWPEAIDSIIASLHAGQSINEAITSLRKYGPIRLRHIFEAIAAHLEKGGALEDVLESEANQINSPSANQLFVTLIHAKEFGGQEVTSTLRLLANFLRDQAAAIEEIETRFGWVKNSAVLGAFAPWLLLALLSMQQSTVEAFATDSGRVVLTIGIVATAVAFIWMERMAKLPTAIAPLHIRVVETYGTAPR